MLFNSDSSLVYSSINLRQEGFKDDVMDDIIAFGGAKVDNRWYFFFLENLVVPRDYYQDSLYSPLTFEKLSLVSHDQLLDHAIRKKEDGSYEPNEEFFKYEFRDPFGYGDNANWDSSVVANAINYHAKRMDPAEIEEIKRDMANSKRPPEPIKDGFWERWYKKAKHYIPSKGAFSLIVTFLLLILASVLFFAGKRKVE